MDKITFFESELSDGTKETHVLIDHGNEQFTSMPEAVYDAQVKHLTEIPTPDEA